jgi:radical SAM protein with 4Fe4S-binding SPASM domain
LIESKIEFHKNLNASQRQRLLNHRASVRLSEDGDLEVLETDIINPKGQTKTNRLISVLPQTTETIETFKSAKHLFQDLNHLNAILTNACNLSCTYCYEQHNKDYGRFTVESLRQAWEWLLNVNDKHNKTFQFFGGEPLIHKQLMLDFINSDPEYFQSIYDNDRQQVISVCTNGLLLDNAFITEYFSKPYTYMLLSLDTINAEIDHRQIDQISIDKLLDYISVIPQDVKENRRVVIRCTLSEETAPFMNEFIDEIYARGVRQMIVHPLILDSSRGFISWANNSWEQLHQNILHNLDKYSDLQIQFVEGVGKKHESNCMVGADMIAIDASGDFSGCYFFTNMKTNGTGHTILGNILKDKVYTDRYTSFQKAYNEMFDSEEQCKTCDYRNACYQCPAGNTDTGSKLFRPDDMCQKIVKLYIDLQDDVAKKSFMRVFDKSMREANEHGFDHYVSASLAMLALLYFSNNNLPLKDILMLELPEHTRMVNWFCKNLDNNYQPFGPEEFNNIVDNNQQSVLHLYNKFAQLHNLNTRPLETSGTAEDIFYINTIAQMIVNQRLKPNIRGMMITKAGA